MDYLAACADGFQHIDAADQLKTKALENLKNWLTLPDFEDYRPQIQWLVEQARWSDLLDSFYQVLPFGTGGRRGAVGIGPNRMNLWTKGASVQGHCEYLKQRFPTISDLKVVLAYDVRQFEDQRQKYNSALPNPVLHLSSRDFAQYAARIYAANGIHAFILPPESERYLATPELSFAIRYLQAHGGLNVSASHNPPDDNGGKFYDERGGQPVPPEDQMMSDLVDQVNQIRTMEWADAVQQKKIHYLDDQTHLSYIDLCRKQALINPPKEGEIRIVYTPLHGVGGMTTNEALAAAGFKTIPVEEQMKPDGQFPNVTKSPNPEVKESLDRAELVARKYHAFLAIATDPDADRLGGLASTTIKGDGDFRFISGNELCSLLTHYKLTQLQKQGRMPKSPVVVTTEVTTSMVGKIARDFSVQIVENLLVGFKFIANVIWHLESTGEYEDVEGTPADFVLGCEESHGLQTTAEVRDKDSGGAAVLMAEMALDQLRQGRTVVDYLDSLARKYGYYRNEVINIQLPGIEGRSNMTRMLETLRSAPPTTIAGLQVTKFEDLRDENGRMGPHQGQTDASGRNVLIFRLGDHAKVVLRPSGTEPKAKAYLEVCTDPWKAGIDEVTWNQLCHEADLLVQKLATEFLTTALETVGMKPAPGADRLNR
ncbi:MAG: phospho-sugar mutase [Zavarzinella sp.]